MYSMSKLSLVKQCGSARLQLVTFVCELLGMFAVKTLAKRFPDACRESLSLLLLLRGSALSLHPLGNTELQRQHACYCQSVETGETL